MLNLQVSVRWTGAGLHQKQKAASYTDLKRGVEGLKKLKAYQDEVNNK